MWMQPFAERGHEKESHPGQPWWILGIMKRLIVPLLLLSQGWLCADSKPFQGKVHKIPGKVEAEHYDEGPPGVAYQDTDEANQGADYREATQVDIEKRSDASNGHGIGWTRKGEWLHYTVEVEKGGTYTLEMPVASQKKGGRFVLQVEGQPICKPIQVPDTGGWTQLQKIQCKGVRLKKGQQVIRVVMLEQGPSGSIGDIDYFHFIPATSGSRSPVPF